MTDYAENNTYESPSSERDRHVDVQRSLCREVERTAGQGGTHHTGTRRENRDTIANCEVLGQWNENTAPRQIPHSCKSTRYFGAKFTPERVNSCLFSENSGKIFFAETLENKESGRFSVGILEKMGQIPYPPIAKIPIVSYNRHIPIGANVLSQSKTGLESASNTRKSLTANLNELDLLLGLTIPRVGILTSGSSQSQTWGKWDIMVFQKLLFFVQVLTRRFP